MEGIIKMLEINTGALSIFALCSVLMCYRKDCDKMKNIVIAHRLAIAVFSLNCIKLLLKIMVLEMVVSTKDIISLILWGVAIIIGCYAKRQIRKMKKVS